MQQYKARVSLIALALLSTIVLGGCDFGTLRFGCDASLMGDQPPSLESAAAFAPGLAPAPVQDQEQAVRGCGSTLA